MDALMPPELEAQITAHRERLAELLPQQLRLLAEVLRRARRYGYCWAQQRTLAEAIGGAKSTVASDLRDFAALDLMRILKADVASRSGAYAEALGRSDVLVPAVGVEQALCDLRIAQRRTARLARVGTTGTTIAADAVVRLGRPRQTRPTTHAERSARSRAAGTGTNATVRDRVRPGTIQDVERRAGHEFRPKARPGLTLSSVTPSSNLISSARATLRPRDAVPKADDDERTALLVAEGFDPGSAVAFAACFDRERIARNIALGRHRRLGVQSPGAYLRGMIQRDDAAAAVNPRSEAARVATSGGGPTGSIRSQLPASSTTLPAAITPAVPEPLLRAAAIAAVTATAADGRKGPPDVEDMFDTLPTAERERLAQRAREDVRRRHAYLGARALAEWGPFFEAATTRTLRDLARTGRAEAGR